MAVKILNTNGLQYVWLKIKDYLKNFIKADGTNEQFAMGDGSKLDAIELVKKLPSDYLKRGGVVGLNSSSTTKPWFKLLTMTQPNRDQNRNITLFVHKINAPGDACGILSVNAHTGGSNQWTDGYLMWEYVGEGINTEDFVYAHAPDGIGITEVWVKCESNWCCYGFEILYESIGAERNLEAFEIQNGRKVEGEETPTPEYTTFTSSIAHLQGHTASPVSIANNEEAIEKLAQNESFVSALAENTDFIEKIKSSIG